MSTNSPYPIYPSGDHAITIELGNEINIAINQKVIGLFQYLSGHPIGGVKDIIPAYNTLTLVYDIGVLQKKFPGNVIYKKMQAQLQEAVLTIAHEIPQPQKPISIPVCYDISLAPDLALLAQTHLLSIDEVIELHTAAIYHVYMTGFLPGFAYMGSVDKRIVTPRKQQPRIKVPAGSVGIAGEQTGIYPFDSPGGWQLIGQTPVLMFDPEKEKSCFLQAGDQVQFHAITLDEFKRQQKR